MSRLQYKYIKYSGYSTLPDDYQAEDGAIAFATNTIFEDGGLKGIPESVRMKLVVAQGAKVYIHHTVNYYHYIVIYQIGEEVKLFVVDRERMQEALEEGTLYIDAIYHEGSTGDLQETMTQGVVDFLYSCEGQFVDVQAVANTLIVSTDKDMYYFLCKTAGAEEGTTPLTESCTHYYIFLGNKVPSVELQFGLELECKMKNYFDLGLTLADLAPASRSEYMTLFAGAKTIGGVDIDGAGTYAFGKAIKLSPGKRYGLWYAQAYSRESMSMELRGINSAGEAVTIRSFGSNMNVFSVSEEVDVADVVVSSSETGEILLEEIDCPLVTSGTYLNYTEENYEAVAGCINKFVADYGRNAGKFIHPFFVRYAVRLYDESVCELSVPILMTPNSDYAPFVWMHGTAEGDGERLMLGLYAFIGTLQYKLLSSIDSNWRDIVQSVDIYVSSPIYPYNLDKENSPESGLFTYKTKNEGEDVDQVTDLSFGIGYLKDQTFSSEKLYRKHDLYTTAHDMYGLFYWSYSYLVQAAAKDADSIDEEIKDTCNFYLIKRLTLDEMRGKSDFEDVKLEDGVLEGLEARESLQEDVVAYEQMVGCGLHSYNSRLHAYGGNMVYRDFAYPAYHVQAETYESGSTYFVTEAWVYIRTNDGTKCVKATYDLGYYYTRGFMWLFYPNNRAFKVVLKVIAERNYYYEFPLSEHNFLNGAYYFERTKENFIDASVEHGEALKPSEDDVESTIPSTSVYVSEVNNPFTFKNSTAVTVGSGQVLALSSAAQAMSQGQFGQYPLYVFTDEGVWALEVDSDGTYKTSQPITRDVCTNVASITQLDSSVLFVTDRGIMHLRGSKVECISESIDGEFGEFNPLDLPYFDEIYLKYLCDGDDLSETERESKLEEIHQQITEWAQTRFFDFIRTCRILYDYVHQRIIVYNNTSSIAYNFSLKTKSWSLMFTRLRYTLNSYPYALALCNLTTEQKTEYGIPQDGEEHWELVDMSSYNGSVSSDSGETEPEEEEDTAETMMFVTRPLKLDNPNMFKTVDSIAQRGYFQQSKKENHIVGTVLYGSADLFNWFLVGQSATTKETDGGLTSGHIIDKMEGSPYKYFRVMVLARLDEGENVSGCSVLYEPKDTNQLR